MFSALVCVNVAHCVALWGLRDEFVKGGEFVFVWRVRYLLQLVGTYGRENDFGCSTFFTNSFFSDVARGDNVIGPSFYGGTCRGI